MKIFKGDYRYAIGFLLLVATIMFASGSASAATWSWTSGLPVVVNKQEAGSEDTWRKECEAMFSTTKVVVDVNGTGTPSVPKTQCLLGEGRNHRVFTYDGQRELAIQFTGDSYAHAIRGVNCNGQCVYMASRDTLIKVDSKNDYGSGRVAIYKDFVKRLQLRNILALKERYYSPNIEPDETISDLNDPTKYIGFIRQIKGSSNDKWLLMDIIGTGIFRYDMDSGELFKFSDWKTNYSYSPPSIEFAITDDGQHIVVAGQNTINSVFDIVPGCGAVMPKSATVQILSEPLQVSCPSRWLAASDGPDTNATIPNFRDAMIPKFNVDGGQLSYFVTSFDSNIKPRYVTVRAAGYAPRQLEYLALGDSYSSGEGDTEKNSFGAKYYRDYTDSGNEKCHLSTRSYPYRLAALMQLTITTQWNSVACSGATSWDAKSQGTLAYLGQNDRLKGLSATTLKAQALNEFIPGRKKQIEFVKKYQPKVITLTMGGNDIGFGSKITRCAILPTTCDTATSKRMTLKNEILDQYENLKYLYKDLYVASGSRSKIYVAGYPSFINGDNLAPCALNVGFVNTDERIMIQNSVTLMNNVIRQAAKAAGVKYIDIENSLSGHRLCDVGKKYVTGITDLLNSKGNRQESFHPNTTGNQSIASAFSNIQNLNSKSPLDYDNCPLIDLNICPDDYATADTIEIPQYFQASDSTSNNAKYKEMTTFDQAVGNVIKIVTDAYTFARNSIVTITVHSDPVELGQFTVNDQGSLSVDATMPSTVPAGIHTLIVSGETYSGSPVQYEQAILVKGPDSKDVDADGVVDTIDKCMFIPASGADVDSDGVDDGCDAEIGDPLPQSSPAPAPTPTPSPSTIPGSPKPGTAITAIVNQILNIIISIFSLLLSILQRIVIKV